MRLTIPEFCLICLVGPTGAGKSTFARQHFLPTEIISSDACRGLVYDDDNSLEATSDAFELVHVIASKRLANRRLSVIDATSVKREDRRPLVALAKKYHALPVAIVFNMPEGLCQARNRERPDRNFGRHVLRNQAQQLRKSLRGLRKEGFRHVYILTSPEEVAGAEIERQRLWTDRRDDQGPFDIIGDVHGCFDELRELLEKLGYKVSLNESGEDGKRYASCHPEGRRLVFLGDLVDRGPSVPEVLRLVMDLVDSGAAICIPGNHEVKLLRKLRGRNVKVTHGLAETLAQLEGELPEFHDRVAEFIDGLISHCVFDDGRLVVAHAGLMEDMQGRSSAAVRDFCLYGETTGETDEFGLPIRYNWAADYRGRAMVVYGHTPVPEAEWLNNTICIDTGCVFGGKLTALCYPERELVQIAARETYFEPVRPLEPAREEGFASAQQAHDDLLDLADVQGKRILQTELRQSVTINAENAAAALEVMSRFAIDPKWLIYLPPTMAPSDTSQEPGLLEHPEEAFAYFEKNGVERIVCQEKHMGSRAIVVACRDQDAARERFGVVGDGTGMVYTRTGRPFFNDAALHAAVLEQVCEALERADFWSRFETDWVALDCELMPWSAKAQALLLEQYAPVGVSSRVGLSEALDALTRAAERGVEVGALRERYEARLGVATDYVDAYRRYCWPVTSVGDLKLAPFHLLATEGAVHADKDHLWHMQTLADLCDVEGGLLIATSYRLVDIAEPDSRRVAVGWWRDLTDQGGEGMVVKPHSFVAKGRRGLVQPALKCRGREYLRIIYGPEYTLPEHLERLRARALSKKRSLALREFALGIEGLTRFVKREPLRRVH
ncbi:MAG: polynucleotide kinase-phosphatase, partial [Alphaproteobacteria bacterium]